MAEAEVSISLTADEALVLFELLHRWEDQELVDEPAHVAEKVVLWNLSALLERELRQPFTDGYEDSVAEARMRLAPKD